MALFGRRRETLNERLLREGGLDAAAEPPAPYDPLAATSGKDSPWSAIAAATTLSRPRQWDAVVTVDAPGLPGDAVEFTVVDAETLLVDEEEGDADLAPLADAVERELAPPYRARGTRRSGTIWAVAANRIQVVALKAEGDAIDVAVHDGRRQAALDGLPTTRGFPALERLGEAEGRDYAVHAERLDGDLWEVRVSAL